MTYQMKILKFDPLIESGIGLIKISHVFVIMVFSKKYKPTIRSDHRAKIMLIRSFIGWN